MRLVKLARDDFMLTDMWQCSFNRFIAFCETAILHRQKVAEHSRSAFYPLNGSCRAVYRPSIYKVKHGKIDFQNREISVHQFFVV
jgi:hypothetical protein